ncbi:cell wall protein DAN4 [Diachasma alloeum]|uniref:cell wall protein DAN4 n=1 Tax=Diachasma alloeum TaxID=454923 RepID=UPI0007383290|nr:cell wall protein DAN4 [Diachasma alloeum]
MILLLYFLSLLTLGRCLDQLPSKHEIESSINRTIDEVERLIKSDQNLPRLSRSQIVEILQNITSKDMENYEESIEQMRSDYQRALMVVLPYNSKDSAGEDLQDLYTKPPMVQVIPDSEIMLPFASIQEEPLPSTRSNINLISPKGPEDSKNQVSASSHEHKNHRNSYSDVKADDNPEKFTLNQNNLLKRNNQKTFTTQKSQLEVTYSTSSTERSTTPSEDYVSSTIPTTRSTNILTSDQWRYNAPPSTTPRPRTGAPQRTTAPATASPTKKPVKTPAKSKPFLPTVISAFPTLGTFAKPALKTTAVPEVVTFNMADMEMMNDAPTAPLYVTPLSSSPSQGAAAQGQTTPMRKEVANLLAAIGLQPSQSKIKTEEAFVGLPQSDILGEDFAIPENNFIPSKTVGLTSTISDAPSIVHQNTFDNSQSDLQKGVSNLSPELQSLFLRFGLPVSGKEPDNVSATRKPEPEIRRPTTVDSWKAFRPLPTSEIKDEEMRSFLATFGLGEVREKKAMKTTTEAPSVIEAVPDNMKSILENIGLITRSRASGEMELQGTTGKPLHVFKPHEVQIDDETQKNKINELLDTVKLVQEGKAGVDDVRNAANRLMKSTKILQGGPDSVSLEEILQMYNQDLRNEVKRQEDEDNEQDDLGDVAMSDSSDNEMSASEPSESTMAPNSTSPADTPPAPDSTGDSSDTAGRVVNSTPATPNSSSSTEGPSLEDLANSFGGTTAAPDPVLPTPRRSGLYFLVDWNTFLEVGEEDKDKVNLRFSPNAGDRARFIPVVVP